MANEPPFHPQSPPTDRRPHPVRIEWVPTTALRPNPRNARTHSKKQIRKIAASIKAFGFTNPIVVDDLNVVLAGHGRLEAARAEGLDRVATVRLDHLSAAQKRAYLLADNKIAEEAGWDRERLALELGELVELLPPEGLEVSLTGFEPSEIDLVVADHADRAAASEDAIPPVPEVPVTWRGDLWVLGRHRLLCADARDPLALRTLMAGQRASCAFLDPPYNVRIRDVVGRGRIRHEEFACASGEMSREQFGAFLGATLGHAAHASVDGAVHFVCTDWRHVAELIDVARPLYGAWINLCVWAKTNAGQGSFYRSAHELIGVFRVGSEPHRNNVELGRFGRNRSNVWTYPGVNSFGAGRLDALASHPTVKPTQLVIDAFLDCTRRGDVVLDLFAGSGTTLLAAERIGRRCHGIEIEPRYVDVAIKRWQATTRRDAVLEGDGRTFGEIAEVRQARWGEPPFRDASAAPSAAERPGVEPGEARAEEMER